MASQGALDLTATNAAAWVKYCNGSAATVWGAVRAARGRQQPYGVKTWLLGNELWSFGQGGMNNAHNCAAATAAFARAIQAVAPSVNLVGCLNGAGSWTATLLGQAGRFLSYGSYHRYGGNGALQTAAKAATLSVRPALQSVHAAYGRPVTFEEWNTYWGLTGSVSMEMYAAGVLNLLGREAPALGVAQAYFFQPITEGAITVRPSTAQLDTAGTVFDEQTNRLPVVANGVLLTLPRCSLAVVDTEVRSSDFSERGHSCPLKTGERSGGGQECPRSYCPSGEAMEKSGLRTAAGGRKATLDEPPQPRTQ